MALRDIVGDLRELWSGEFAGASISEKIAFSLLRLIQHMAYRRGYGCGHVVARAPSPRAPDFSFMDRNLSEMPAQSRLSWLHSFLGQVNAGVKHTGSARPRSVILELANTCNYNCTGCGIGRCGIDESRFMAPDDLRAWVRESCGNSELIRVNGLGEATLHPRFYECLEILAGLPGSREIITNGSASVELYDALLDAGFVVLVSWDGCTPETFEHIRRGSDYGELSRKLPLIAERARKRGAPDPVLLFTLRPENTDELAGTVSAAASFGVTRLTVNVFKSPDGADWTAPMREEICAAFAEAEEVAVRRGVRFCLPDHLGEKRVSSTEAHRCSDSGCTFPWTQVAIRWNGDIIPCNMMNPYCYGNMRSRTFAESWLGPEAGAFRDMANTGNRHPYCAHCYYVDTTRRAVAWPSIAG